MMKSNTQSFSSKNKYIIDIKNFKAIREINKGGYGSILQVEDQKTNKIYAAKVIVNKESNEKYKKFVNREIGILIRLQHPTIINFIGYSLTDFTNSSNVTLIMQFAKRGSLAEVLSKVRKGLSDKDYNNTARQIILIGIARGMMFLHDNNTIHRDLKPDNILLDENLRPLITDFGLSKICDTISTISHSISCGTSIYIAPEVMEDKKYGGKADVYSFGILMYEVVTDQIPFPLFQSGKMENYSFNHKVIKENYRPEFNVPVKPSLRKLIERCWSGNPNDRPTFEEIFKKLAFNVEDSIYDVFDEEEDNEDDEYKYYLDDVDADEVLCYLDDLNVSPENSINLNSDGIEKVTQRLESIEKENEKLKRENEELKRKYEDVVENEINSLKIKNEQLSNINDQIMKILTSLVRDNNLKMSNSNDFSIDHSDSESKEKENENNVQMQSQGKVVTIRDFNSLSLKSQQHFVNEIVKKKNPSFFTKIIYGTNSIFSNINKLLLFLMKFSTNNDDLHFFRVTTNSTNQPFDCLKNSDQDKNFICILSPSAIETLYNNNALNSSEFINILKQFTQPISIELRYPFDQFYSIFDIVTNIKKNDISKLRISLIINEIKESNRIFKQNELINYITFKSSNPIGERAFYQCTSLIQVMFNENIKKIESNAFFGCSSLKFISNLDSVEMIGESAFENCSSLRHVNFPSSLKSIGDRAFAGCSSITQVIIPSNVKTIGMNAFTGCSSLTQIFAPPSLQIDNIGTNEKTKISRTD